MSQPPLDKILIIQTAFLGDVVLATGLIEKVRIAYPNARIDFLLRKGNEGLFEVHPHIDKLYVFDKSNKWRSLAKNIKAIRKERYDYVINVQRFFSSGLITVLSGGIIKVGFKKNPLSRFFDLRVEHTVGDGRHELERNQALIDTIVSGNYSPPKLYPGKENKEKVSVWQNDAYICIAPTSVWHTKQWPAEKWIETIKSIGEDYIVYLLGGPSDVEECHKIESACQDQKVISLAGKLSLLQSAALMQGAVMNFTNDSAPTHMASAVNAPITSVFCSTVPEFGFGPVSHDAAIIQTKESLSCRPCGLHGHRKCPEGHFKCAKTIEAGRLVARVPGKN